MFQDVPRCSSNPQLVCKSDSVCPEECTNDNDEDCCIKSRGVYTENGCDYPGYTQTTNECNENDYPQCGWGQGFNNAVSKICVNGKIREKSCGVVITEERCRNGYCI